MRAEDQIEGDRAFRLPNGYVDLLEIFRRRLNGLDVSIRTDTVVERVSWKRGHAEVRARDSQKSLEKDSSEQNSLIFSAPRLLVTVPLAVLQAAPGEAGVIEFDPGLSADKVAALDKLEMGKIVRVVLRFRHRFWDRISPAHSAGESLSDMGFLFTEDEWFPTWWT